MCVFLKPDLIHIRDYVFKSIQILDRAYEYFNNRTDKSLFSKQRNFKLLILGHGKEKDFKRFTTNLNI